MNFENLVENIKRLAWEKLSGQELQTVMILSAYAAREFAESLRIALGLYPTSHVLREMASEELQTSNLRFEDYAREGDHGDLLWYFIGKYKLTEGNREAVAVGEKYFETIRQLSPEIRAMSIFSRERELPGIFTRILEAKDWSQVGLSAFQYYIEEHIRLDSKDGGHADMLADFTVTDEVTPFYRARLDLYRCLPKLFS
ncbi:MAG: DUF3050 domain-containing protein [Candidatus Taylorbacteria bacterium]|nr:DUF3050 domain-containing protein [Candidatus Taylorbacteria bacterium]